MLVVVMMLMMVLMVLMVLMMIIFKVRSSGMDFMILFEVIMVMVVTDGVDIFCGDSSWRCGGNGGT